MITIKWEKTTGAKGSVEWENEQELINYANNAPELADYLACEYPNDVSTLNEAMEVIYHDYKSAKIVEE